jgi:hypothetical protein
MKLFKILPLGAVPIIIVILLASIISVASAQNPPMSKTYSNELCGLSIKVHDIRANL